MDNVYDIIIIGGGPGGLTAAIYASRNRRRTAVIDKALPGGNIALTHLVENYPGFPEGIGGFDLGQRLADQAQKFGAELVLAEAMGVDLGGAIKAVRTSEGDYRGRCVIIASGASSQRLGVPGEERLTGRGVSYCATCDGAFFQGQPVAVVGGGNAALEETLFLTRYADRITVVHRRDQLRADAILQERARAEPKIGFAWDSVVEEVLGDSEVSAVRLRNVKTGATSELAVAGVFVYVGLLPNTQFLGDAIALDSVGQIAVNIRMETALPGVFAAGDLRSQSPRQAITAAGDGAIAALSAERYLSELG